MFKFFYDELSNLKSSFPYIYDNEGNETEEVSEVSLGYSERQAFVDDYGQYMEMIYIYLSSPFGHKYTMNEIFKLTAHEFLFVVEYLIRKRKIENKK